MGVTQGFGGAFGKAACALAFSASLPSLLVASGPYLKVEVAER